MTRWIPVVSLLALTACGVTQTYEERMSEAGAVEPSEPSSAVPDALAVLEMAEGEPADEGQKQAAQTREEAPPAEQVATLHGVLGSLSDDDLAAAGGLHDSIGGLVGAKGTELGAGGLGSRGIGVGGGGRSAGLGGIGTKGSGGTAGLSVIRGDASGYGSGAGAYGAARSEPPAPPVASNEHYTDYGVNGFVDAGEDSLSTFAVDVDTASYTMVRRKLREGYLPAPASARVEEFVNYFPYDYKRPEETTPFAVDFEASPSPYNPVNHIVRVGVQGKTVAFDQRKSVHLTFLVDVSGSMQSSDKIGLLKQTLKMLTEELEDGDTVAIATYAGATKVVLEPTPMSRSAEILRALDRLTAGGSTAMGAGIDLAYGLADASLVEGAVNRVIVCSDGDANVGQTSHEALSATIRGYAEKGVTLTTVGFGRGNYQDTMMERLANDGDGNYYYIDSEREARRVFVDKLTGTLEVIAKDVKIQVDWDPEDVIAYRLIGYENRDIADRDFRNDKVDAGEIGAGHQVTALYEVALRDHPQGSIATVRVRNKAPGADAPAVERSFELSAEAIAGTFAATSRQFRIATAAAGFAELLRNSPHMQEVRYRDVEAIARSAARAEFTEDSELVELIDRAADLVGEDSVAKR